ncbi:hypothetical protein [Caldanaerobius polysaccharolyticus]|uniref:hypothetical protein n=1 Tax=Caldanaerobius polysaccharolyticus TaxID=44256 RepID=UPI00047B709A|nr:hypothetical protein [Caldanaerobius polysaccharolyticus]
MTYNKTLERKLKGRVGNRALVMMEQFPFFMVEKLVNVSEVELKGKVFCIQYWDIAAIYAEKQPGEIPETFS